MKGLPKSELKKGEMYQCLISRRAVLITTHFRDPGYDSYTVKGWVYNPITGIIDLINIAEGQLAEMPE